MKSTINKEIIQGRVFESSIEEKVVQKEGPNKGKKFLSGTLSVATDDENKNVVPIQFRYVTETTKAGKVNQTYKALERIMNATAEGKETDIIVKVDTNAWVNEFYPDPEQDVVVSQRSEGGFVTILSSMPDEKERNSFQIDALISKVQEVEVNEEKGINEPFVRVNGLIFNFAGAVAPFTFVARSQGAIDYFTGLGVSSAEPLFTQLRGKVIASTIKIEKKVESAFGDDAVDIVTRRQREWLITSASKVPYEFGDEAVLTMDEVKAKVAERQVRLSEIKAQAIEWAKNREQRKSQPAATATVEVSDDGFDF